MHRIVAECIHRRQALARSNDMMSETLLNIKWMLNDIKMSRI